jgi:hypothetical protein
MLPTIDAYTPREIAHKIATLGVTKARSDTLSLLVLAVLAGAFITRDGARHWAAQGSPERDRSPGAGRAVQRPGVSSRVARYGGRSVADKVLAI